MEKSAKNWIDEIFSTDTSFGISILENQNPYTDLHRVLSDLRNARETYLHFNECTYPTFEQLLTDEQIKTLIDIDKLTQLINDKKDISRFQVDY